MSNLSRRRFLATAAALSSAAVINRPMQTLAALLADAGLPVGIQMYSLRGYSVDDAIQHAHDIGFRHLEFYSGQYPLNSTPEQIAAMNAKLSKLGCKITAHGVNRFTKDHEKNEAIFKFAKAAGIRNLSADPDPDSFESLDKLVAQYDIRIGIHNHGPKHRYNKIVDVLNAVRDHHPHIGACADLGHFIRSGEPAVEVIRSLGGRLFGIHLKDFAEMTDKTKGVILGKGHLDVEGTFRALRQVNFPADGAISLEYEENPKDPIADIKECFAIATAAAKKVG
ncbi:MAG: sugar phosphate isomerase/epimerase [Planctomycetaceae bacterium]|nr:sugar phosphate isomerase/epimerase [Planctomycetaceae bacterium]